jgi:O-antigen/teichoic acid export membrane protein
MNIGNIKSDSLKSIKWSALSELLTRAVQPTVMIFLARILSPEDFGLVAIATIIISAGQVFLEFGMGKALIQTDSDVELYRNNALWTNVLIAFIVYIIVFFNAGLIGNFFNSPESAIIIKVLGIQFILNSFFSSNIAFFQRELKFSILFKIRTSASLGTAIVSLSLAALGYGVWALVFGALIGSFIQLCLCWIYSTWNPVFKFNKEIFFKMFNFSKWILFEGVFAWLLAWGDSIAVGHMMNPEELGKYRIGNAIIILISNIVFTPIIPIALSYFSRIKTNKEELRNSYEKLTGLIAYIAVPIAVMLVLLSHEFVFVVLGEKWVGVEIIIIIMGIRFGFGWLVGLNSTVFTAIGRPDVNSKLLVIITTFTLPIYFFSAEQGILFFLYARLGTSILDNMGNYIIAKKYLKINLKMYFRILKLPLLSGFGMWVIVTLFQQLIDGYSIYSLVLSFIIGVSTYLFLSLIIDKVYFKWALNYFINILKK